MSEHIAVRFPTLLKAGEKLCKFGKIYSTAIYCLLGSYPQADEFM